MHTSKLIAVLLVVASCGPDSSTGAVDDTDVGQVRQALVLFNQEVETWGGSTASVSGASAGQVGTFANKSISMSGTPQTMVVQTWATTCQANATARIQLSALNFGQLADLSFAPQTLTTFTITLPANMWSSFVLNMSVTGSQCSRNYVDFVRIEGVALLPPPPSIIVQGEAATGAGTIDSSTGVTARRFTAVGSATASFSTAAPLAQLVVYSRGLRCTSTSSTLPRIRVLIDGAQVIDQIAPGANSWGPTTVPIAVAAGNHTITFSHDNDFNAPPCDASLLVDRAQLNP